MKRRTKRGMNRQINISRIAPYLRIFIVAILFISPMNVLAASDMSTTEESVALASISSKKICIDPGHGGSDPGAIGFGLKEKDVNLDIALRLKNLLTNNGAIPILTRSSDTYVSLSNRVQISNSNGCERFISIHSNGFSDPAAKGTETYWKKHYNNLDALAQNLAQKVNPKLVSYLGTVNRGVKTKSLYVLTYTNMPAILVETAFITNPTDNAKLADPIYRQKAAQAILDGLKEHYATNVLYQAHFANIGWMTNWVQNGQTAGTPGGNQMEAIKIKTSSYGITYRAHVAYDGWLPWVSNGAVAGTTGQGKSLQAIEIKLFGAPPNSHVYYRVYVHGQGWKGWVSDGATAGTTGLGLAIEAIEIKIVE